MRTIYVCNKCGKVKHFKKGGGWHVIDRYDLAAIRKGEVNVETITCVHCGGNHES